MTLKLSSRITFHILLLFCMGFLIYFNSLEGEFLWDDYHFVVHNMHIKSWSYLPKILTSHIASGSFNQYSYYRPIQELTYMIDYHFWKSDVRGYHLTNILIHLLAGCSVYTFIYIVFQNAQYALWTSLFFLIHPIQTEAVNAIAGRAEPLVAFFMLGAFILYWKILQRYSPLTLLLMISCYILALLTKENALVFPLLILFFHWYYRKRIIFRYLFLIFLCIGLYLSIRWLGVVGDIAPLNLDLSSILQRLPSFFHAFVQYTRLLLIPLDLHFDYGQKLFSYQDFMVIVGLSIYLFFIGLIWQKRREQSILGFAIAWVIITLLPYTNIIPLYSYMAEHYLYVPHVGFSLILGHLVMRLSHYPILKRIALFISVGVVSIYCILTIKQNSYWNEEIGFYERTIRYNPTRDFLYNNLGAAYGRKGNFNKEMEAYQKALSLNPDSPLTWKNLGMAYMDLGDFDLAERYLVRAIDLDPQYLKAYDSLGVVYIKLGSIEKAKDIFQKVMEINPRFPQSHLHLGALYRDLKEYDLALEHLKTSLELDKTNPTAFYNLALVYYDIGKLQEALEYLEKTVELSPNFSKAYLTLALIYYQSGNNKQAVESFKGAYPQEEDTHRIMEILGKIQSGTLFND